MTYASWHWIFIINIPIGLLGIFYAIKHMPNFTMPKRKFDLLGFIFFGFGLVMLSVSLDLFLVIKISRYIPIAIILGDFLY